VREKVEREGADVVLVLDTSGSMAADDVAPNRFFLARAALLSVMARLEGDRLGLLAFEGEAYPLVPLTLDADAVGLFLETLEPGVVPAAGSSIGVGLSKALEMFVDKERRNKVIVLVSDGENLEGEVAGAVARAKEAGVLVHAVGVGTPQGAPVPEVDSNGVRVGFKKDEAGAPVLSRLNADTLEAIARGTGGRFFQITPSDSSLSALASAIEGLEQRSVAREYSYRKKDRFQVPLAVAFLCAAVALALPMRRRRPAPAAGRAVAAALVAVLATAAGAQAESITDEALLRPKRATDSGRKHFAQGNHPEALKEFQKAAEMRPNDPHTRFNLADAHYKNGQFEEAETAFRALGADAGATFAHDARFNLGNTLFQKKDYPGAVRAYRDALRLRPNDADTRRNLELALRAQQQEKQKQPQPQPSASPSPQPSPRPQPQGQPSPSPSQAPRPQTPEEKEQQRFKEETGMPRDRAMQLLDALQQNEKEEQKRLMAARQTRKKPGKDW
jgi:Ca-activated chloride channel family protein